MEHFNWKPKSWLSIVFAIFTQSFAFLYVNKARWFWFYLGLSLVLGLVDIKLHTVIHSGSWYESIYFSWLLLIVCPVHAYLVCRHYDITQERSWYASWWGTLVSFFLLLTLVFIIRTFFIEPFSIPATSMSPTLKPGDQVVISKWGYGNYRYLGIRVLQSAPATSPQRGDIVVFQYPQDPQIDFIKRVIGLPGDRIIYRNKTLYIQPACANQSTDCAAIKEISRQQSNYSEEEMPFKFYQERLMDVDYTIKINSSRQDATSHYFFQSGTKQDEWVVPDKHFFVMGDNQDNSLDSRYWGFVEQSSISGKVILVW